MAVVLAENAHLRPRYCTGGLGVPREAQMIDDAYPGEFYAARRAPRPLVGRFLFFITKTMVVPMKHEHLPRGEELHGVSCPLFHLFDTTMAPLRSVYLS